MTWRTLTLKLNTLCVCETTTLQVRSRGATMFSDIALSLALPSYQVQTFLSCCVEQRLCDCVLLRAAHSWSRWCATQRSRSASQCRRLLRALRSRRLRSSVKQRIEPFMYRVTPSDGADDSLDDTSRFSRPLNRTCCEFDISLPRKPSCYRCRCHSCVNERAGGHRRCGKNSLSLYIVASLRSCKSAPT